MTSVRKTLLDSVAMSSVGIMRLLVQFLALPILSRLLSHEDYGLVAMAMPFVFFAMLFSDAGISLSLVRVSMTQHRVWSTCFWLSCGLGVALAASMSLLAPLAAHFLDQPKLTMVLVVLSLVLFLQSLCAVPGAAMQKEQRFRAIAALEIVACVSSLVVAVVVAKYGMGAWALVFQQITLYGIRSVLTLVVSKFRPMFVFDLRDVREHLHFGRDVMGINLAQFLSRWMDNLVIGKFLGTAATGVFAMATQFARLPLMVVSGPLQYVLYARLARVKEDTDSVRTLFLLFTRGLAILIFPSMGMVAAAHAPAFTLLLSEKWAQAGVVFMLVAVSTALQAVTALVPTVLLVLGHPRLRLKAALEFAALWLMSLLLVVGQGLEAVAIMSSLVTLLYTPRAVMMVLPLIGCRGLDYWDALWRPVVLTVLLVAVYHVLEGAAAWGDLMMLVAGGMLAVAGIGLSALWQKRAMMSLTSQFNRGAA